MDDLTLWLIVYLAFGLVILIAFRLFHHFTVRHDDFAPTLLADIRKRDPKPLRKIVLEFVGMALFYLVFMPLWPIGVFIILWDRRQSRRMREAREANEEDSFLSSQEALIRQMTMADIERAEVVHDPLGAAPALPFGHLNPAWETFKEQVATGDEIWSFRLANVEDSPDDNADGYAVVRDGRIVAEFCAHYLVPGQCYGFAPRRMR